LKKIAICTLALALLAQVGLAAFADEPASMEPCTGGPLTRSGNPIWTVASFPLRLTTGVGGMMVGAMVNGSKNIMTTEQEFAKNTFGQASESPMMYPVGVLGSVIAVPVGFVTGMPEGAAMGGRQGYQVWDHL
jgi:hypothetical protein